MFDQAGAQSQRNALTDWVLRAAICLAFLLFGCDKFGTAPDSEWVRFFAQIGLGQWFRYFTGITEITGAILVLLPWTAQAGLLLLASSMAGAAVVHVFVMHHPFNSVIPLAFLAGLVLFWRSRAAH